MHFDVMYDASSFFPPNVIIAKSTFYPCTIYFVLIVVEKCDIRSKYLLYNPFQLDETIFQFKHHLCEASWGYSN